MNKTGAWKQLTAEFPGSNPQIHNLSFGHAHNTSTHLSWQMETQRIWCCSQITHHTTAATHLNFGGVSNHPSFYKSLSHLSSSLVQLLEKVSPKPPLPFSLNVLGTLSTSSPAKLKALLIMDIYLVPAHTRWADTSSFPGFVSMERDRGQSHCLEGGEIAVWVGDSLTFQTKSLKP